MTVKLEIEDQVYFFNPLGVELRPTFREGPGRPFDGDVRLYFRAEDIESEKLEDHKQREWIFVDRITIYEGGEAVFTDEVAHD